MSSDFWDRSLRRCEDLYRDRGFVANRDKIGYSGVETSLDDILLGRNGTARCSN